MYHLEYHGFPSSVIRRNGMHDKVNLISKKFEHKQEDWEKKQVKMHIFKMDNNLIGAKLMDFFCSSKVRERIMLTQAPQHILFFIAISLKAKHLYLFSHLLHLFNQAGRVDSYTILLRRVGAYDCDSHFSIL